MAKTLLDGVNDVLDRVGILDANGTLSSLTNQGKQLFIDLAVQIWNETVDEACNMMGLQHPDEDGFDYSLELVTAQRNYFLPDNLIQIRWPLIASGYGYFIWEYPGGFEQMRIDQAAGMDGGLPQYAAILNFNQLYLDRDPTDEFAGITYEILFDKDNVMEAYSDAFPFSDAAYRALLPVVAEGWERRKRNDFDLEEYRKHMARALAFINKVNRRTHW